jgi:hypothetical protein
LTLTGRKGPLSGRRRPLNRRTRPRTMKPFIYGNAMAVTSRALEKMGAAIEELRGTQSEKKVLADRNDTLTEYVIKLENAASGNAEASAKAVRVAA